MESFPDPDPLLRQFGTRQFRVYVHTNDIDTKFMQCESERCPELHTVSVMHLDVAIDDVVEGQVWMEWVGYWRVGLYNWTRLTMGDEKCVRVRAKISCPWPECPNYHQWWDSNPFQHVKKHDHQHVLQ